MITHVQVHVYASVQQHTHIYIYNYCLACQLLISLLYIELARAYPFLKCHCGLTQNSTIHSDYLQHNSFKDYFWL